MANVSDINVNPDDANLGGFSVLPEGVYRAVITDSPRKHTKSGDGEYLSFKFTIQNGEYAGESVFDNLNLWNPSQQAVRISMQRYELILQKLGTTSRNISETMDLHNIPIDIKVTVEEYSKNDGTKGQRNVIKDFIQVGYANNQQQSQPQQQYQNQNQNMQQQGQGQRPY